MAAVLIDLGDVSPERAASRSVPPRPPRPRRFRGLLAGLSVLLAAVLTGAEHRPPPEPPVIIDARLGDLMFVGDGRVFVISSSSPLQASAVQNRIVSAYALPTGDLLSRTTVAVTGPILSVVAAGPVILVSYQVDNVGAEATVALAEGTGRALWRQPYRMLAATGDLALLNENAGQLGTWSAVDIATGAVRWSLREPARGVITVAGATAGFPPYLVVATDTGDLAVRDSRTGDVLATARTPVRERQVNSGVPVWSTDRLVLVGAPDGTNAYELPSLVRRWHSEADLNGRWVQSTCAVAVCALNWQGGLLALDPVTGANTWVAERWTYADQAGPYLLAGDTTGDRPVTAVLDPGTGRIRGEFDGWTTAGPVRADGSVPALRDQLADDTIWYGRLDPAEPSLRVLGRAERVSGDCQFAGDDITDDDADDVLVCRTIDAAVGIWTLK